MDNTRKTEIIEFGSFGIVKVSRIESQPLDIYAKLMASAGFCPANPAGPTFDDDSSLNPGLCLVIT